MRVVGGPNADNDDTDDKTWADPVLFHIGKDSHKAGHVCVCVRMSVSEFMYTGVKLTTLTEIMENTQHTHKQSVKLNAKLFATLLPSFLPLWN